MPIYDPYSMTRNGMGYPIPFNNQLSFNNLGYQGINTNIAPYSNPYNNNYGGYYTNNYNNYYNPYNGVNYWEEVRKQQETYEKNKFKIWELCEKTVGATLNKSKEEITEAIRRHDPNYINQMLKKQQDEKEKVLEKTKEELTARIIIKRGDKVIADSNIRREDIKKHKAANSSFFSMNNMKYVNTLDDYTEMDRLNIERLWLNPLYPVLTFNAQIVKEFEEKRIKYANTPLCDYLTNVAGRVYSDLLLQDELERRKAQYLKNRYNPNTFRDSLYRNTMNNPVYGNFNNYFRQPTQKSDLEIHLPSSMTDDYAARKKMFIDKIMQNAKRVGTDITMNGNINVNEVYNR